MINILIADDKEVFRRKIKRLDYFKTHNDQMQISFEAQNGEEALDIIKNSKVDIIITDIRMPIMDGMALLKEIKTEKLCKCVILLSEYTDFAYAKQGIVYGAFDYIVKPIDNEKITDVLDRAADYLNTIQSTSAFWEDSAAEIIRMTDENDEDYSSLLDAVFSNIKASGCTLSAATGEMKHMMAYIERNILHSRPYMKKFAPVSEICAIPSEYGSSDELFAVVRDSLKRLFDEMNKFSIDTSNTLIKNMCGYIISNIEQEINLQTIADEFFVNKKYLSTCFKKETGVNFIDYITFVKIERAKMLLRDKSMKVYEVAAALGFADTEYFSRVFKQKTGISPSEFVSGVT